MYTALEMAVECCRVLSGAVEGCERSDDGGGKILWRHHSVPIMDGDCII
jgi:hypothetical protein